MIYNDMQYLFQLGREPELSVAELKAVFSLFGIAYRNSPIAYRGSHKANTYFIIDTEEKLDTDLLVRRLGGTIKIAEKISETPGAHLLRAQPEGKILFSLSGDVSKNERVALKKTLVLAGRSVRFLDPKNTATILHNDLVEREGDITALGSDSFVTRAIQPIEELSARDYGRPRRDVRSGMLPPKLAAIMINLAEAPEGGVILDPFCGSGTILMEAMLMGYKNLIGSDISEKAIADTKKNLQWIEKELRITNYELRTIVCDARNLDKKLSPHSVDAVVTEPFLGKPMTGKESPAFIRKQAADLAALYAETLRVQSGILKPNGRVVMAMPFWGQKKISFPLQQFTRLGSYDYRRPGQFVGRTIIILKAVP